MKKPPLAAQPALAPAGAPQAGAAHAVAPQAGATLAGATKDRAAKAATAQPEKARPGFPARWPGAPARKPPAGATGGPPAGRVGQASRAPGAGPSTAAPAAAGKGAAVAEPDSRAQRAAMLRKLQAQGLSHPAVLAAMQAVERHRFVDTALRNQAYEDTSLPIGQGQTISKPNVVARMVELLCEGRSGRLGRVLEIGSGCGYQAAVLCGVADEVYSVERLRGLHEKARENIRGMGLNRLHLILGDGMLGYPKGAPYAAIIAAAGGTAVPQAWIDQLAPGGRLVAPVLAHDGQQKLVVIDKTAHGVHQTVLEPVLFVPLKSGLE